MATLALVRGRSFSLRKSKGSTTSSSPPTHPLTSVIVAVPPQLLLVSRTIRIHQNVPVSGSPRRSEGDSPCLEQLILRIQHLLPEQVTTQLRNRIWYAALRRDEGGQLGTCADCWTEEKDLVIIGGGVAGYVAAIKAGQAGLKVRRTNADRHANNG